MAGTIQRLYNSTLGLPQQVGLRVARMFKDGNYNPFTEDGLWDSALIPFFGFFDDHENDASGRDFTDHAGKAFAIDVLTDPLTYATSGLTATAKAARAVGQVKQLEKLKSGVRGLKDGRSTVQDLIDLGRKTNLPADQARQIDRLESVGDAFRATPLDELAGKASEQELALGIPLLGRAGMQVTVPTAHKSWFKLMNSQYKAVAGMALHLSGARHIPPVRGLLTRMEKGVEAIREGVKASAEPAIRFTPKGESGLEAAAELLNDTGRVNAVRDVTKLEQTAAVSKGWAARWEKMMGRKSDSNEAFLAAAGFRSSSKSAVNRRKAERLLEDLTGQKGQALPQTGEAFEAIIKNAQQDVLTAHGSLRGGQLAVEVVEDMPKFLEEGAARWQSFIFEKSRSAAQTFRKGFLSDVPGTINEKAAHAFKTARAGNSEAALVMTRRGMQARSAAARAEGVESDVYNRAVNALFEGTPTQEELNFSLETALHGGPDALFDFHESLMSYRTRAMNSGNSLLAVLRGQGVKVGKDLHTRTEGARLAPAAHHLSRENFIRDGGEELLNSGRLGPRERIYQFDDGEYLPFIKDDDLLKRVDQLNAQNAKPIPIPGKVTHKSFDSSAAAQAQRKADIDALETEWLLRQDSAFGYIERPPNMRVEPRDFSEANVWPKNRNAPMEKGIGEAYGAMSAAIGDLDDWLARMKKSGGEIRGDDYKYYLDRLGVTMEHYSAEVEDLFRQGFKSKETVGFLDYLRDIQKMSLRAAIETGMVGGKGAPLGYIPRLVSGNSRRTLRKMGSEMDTKGILDATLPNLGAAHKRKLDEFTLEELNALHKELITQDQPELAKRLGDLLDEENLRFERLETDPVLSFMNNYAQKSTTRLTGKFVDDLLQDPNQTHILSGKITGVYEIGEDGLTLGKTPISQVHPETGVVTLGAIDREVDMGRVGVVMETADGRETVVSASALMDSDLQFAEISSSAATPGQGFALAAARGELRTVGMTNINDLAGRVGQNVILGNGKVVSGLMNTVTDQYKRSPDALRVFDAANSWIRAAQTIMRPAFHAANAISGYFQSALLGTSVRNNSAGHILAGRILFGDESAKMAASSDRHLMMLGEAGLIKKGGDPRTIADTIRALGSGEIPKGWENEVLNLGNGRQVEVRELFQEAADGGLMGTFFARGFAGTSTTSESMLEMARRIEKGSKIDDIKGLGEISETWSRFGTYMGRVLEHGDLKLAVKEAKEAMVDYSDLTNFEKNWIKRGSTYYTFSRKYMPFALEQFGKSPRGIGITAKAIQDSGAITTANGRIEVKGPGDMRVNLQRLNANLDAFMLAPALLENFVDTPELTTRADLPAVMAFGGVAGMVTGTDEMFVRDDKPSRSSMWRDQAYTTFATKWAYQGLKFATEGEEVSVLDEARKFFLPTRQIKGGYDEKKMIANNFKKLASSLEYEAKETTSNRRRKFLLEEARRLKGELNQLLDEETR